MKKLLMTLSLMSLAGAAAFGVSSLASGRTAFEVKADGDPVTYIPMAANAFTSESEANRMGDFSATNRTYWDGWSFEALDTFFCGESKGDEKGTITLNSWAQTTQYIYFQWGAAGQDDVYLHFVCTSTTLNTEGKLISEEGGEPYVYTADHRNDTQVDNKLLLRYFEIPTVEYNKLGGVNGFSMTIEFHDQHVGEGYGFHSFGYLHVNQTRAQVGDAMRYYLNHLNTSLADYERDRRKDIQGHYFTNAYLKAIFFEDAGDISDGFDVQADFTNHWYFDHNYFNNVDVARNFDGAISTAENHSGSMPYNKKGAGFFRGYFENDGKGGFMRCDNSRYRFLSRPFTVTAGNPFISIRMGGKASIHVIDATVDPNKGTAADLAWIDARGYSQGGTAGLVYSGYNVTTMKNHIINLEAFAGRKVQLAIADVGDDTTPDDGNGWEAANFDELAVNITPTSFGADKIIQTSGSTYYCVFPDVYVNSTTNWKGNEDSFEIDSNGIHYVNNADRVVDGDQTDVRAAADFLASYYDLARNKDNGASLCSVKTSGAMQTLLGLYNSLSADIKAIINASADYDFGKTATSETWYTIEPTFGTVGASLTYLINENTQNSTNNVWFMGGSSTSNGYIAITAILSAGVIATIAFFLIKKRKHEAE